MEEDIFNTELGRKILALTKASFKVSDLIPDLVLREKIKHQVLDVYKNFFDKTKDSVLLKELDVLDSLFYLAGHLNLAKEDHIKSLRNGFLIFKSHIILAVHDNPRGEKADFVPAKISPEKTPKNMAEKTEEKSIGAKSEKLSNRQEKIIKQFQNKQKLQLSDLTKHFPSLNERTIRNDLSYLIEIGKITRRGKGSGSYYSAENLLEKGF